MPKIASPFLFDHVIAQVIDGGQTYWIDGTMSEVEAKEDTVRGTRRFVRRQRSWFKRDPEIRWLDGASDTLVADALALTE